MFAHLGTERSLARHFAQVFVSVSPEQILFVDMSLVLILSLQAFLDSAAQFVGRGHFITYQMKVCSADTCIDS